MSVYTYLAQLFITSPNEFLVVIKILFKLNKPDRRFRTNEFTTWSTKGGNEYASRARH